MKLSIERTETSPSFEPHERWLDSRGRLLGWSCWRDAEALVAVAGAAVYRLGRGAEAVRAIARPGVPRARVEADYRRIARPLFLQARGWQVLHASAVSTERGVVGLCGRSGAGKSTLASSWAELGGAVWTDDALPFRVANGKVETRRLGTRGGAPARGNDRRRPVIALTVLEAQPPEDRSDALKRLSPAAALASVLPHGLSLDAENPELARRLFEGYTDLVRRVPVYRLRYRQTPEAPQRWVPRLRDRIVSGDPIRDPAALDR